MGAYRAQTSPPSPIKKSILSLSISLKESIGKVLIQLVASRMRGKLDPNSIIRDYDDLAPVNFALRKAIVKYLLTYHIAVRRMMVEVIITSLSTHGFLF